MTGNPFPGPTQWTPAGLETNRQTDRQSSTENINRVGANQHKQITLFRRAMPKANNRPTATLTAARRAAAQKVIAPVDERGQPLLVLLTACPR